MEFFKEGVVDAHFFVLVLLELYIESLGFLVNSTVEILVIVCKFFLLIRLQPIKKLLLGLLFLLIASLSLYSFAIPGLRIQMASFQPQEKMLIVFSNFKAIDRKRQLVLIGEFESIRFVNFKVLVV